MSEVRFPVLSGDDQQGAGALHVWFVHDSARVRAGQLLAEVRAQEVVVEVVAPTGGVVELLVPAGTGVRPGEVLARIL